MWQLTTAYINIWREINNYYYTGSAISVSREVRQGTASGVHIC